MIIRETKFNFRPLSLAIAMLMAFLGAGCQTATQCANLGTVTHPGDPDAEMVPMPNAYGYLHNGPVFAGTEFAGSPQETATEHALRLQKEIEQLGSTRAEMERQVQQLRTDETLKQQSLSRAEHELGMAHRELAAVRDELSRWRSDLSKLRGRLRNSEAAAVGRIGRSRRTFGTRNRGSTGTREFPGQHGQRQRR